MLSPTITPRPTHHGPQISSPAPSEHHDNDSKSSVDFNQDDDEICPISVHLEEHLPERDSVNAEPAANSDKDDNTPLVYLPATMNKREKDDDTTTDRFPAAIAT